MELRSYFFSRLSETEKQRIIETDLLTCLMAECIDKLQNQDFDKPKYPLLLAIRNISEYLLKANT